MRAVLHGQQQKTKITAKDLIFQLRNYFECLLSAAFRTECASRIQIVGVVRAQKSVLCNYRWSLDFNRFLMESSVKKASHYVHLDIHLPVSQEARYTIKITWTSKLRNFASLLLCFVFLGNAMVIFRALDQLCEDNSLELSSNHDGYK